MTSDALAIFLIIGAIRERQSLQIDFPSEPITEEVNYRQKCDGKSGRGEELEGLYQTPPPICPGGEA